MTIKSTRGEITEASYLFISTKLSLCFAIISSMTVVTEVC